MLLVLLTMMSPAATPAADPTDVPSIIAAVFGLLLTTLASVATNMVHSLSTKLTSGVDALRTELKDWRVEMEGRQDALERRLEDVEEREASRSRPHGRTTSKPRASARTGKHTPIDGREREGRS